jgi:hypothetical protein
MNTASLDAEIEADIAHNTAPLDILSKLRGSAAELVMRQREVRELTQRLEAAQSEVKRLSEEVLPSLMDTAGLKDFTLDTDDHLERTQAVFASISQENMQEAVAWLDANKYGNIVKSEFRIPLEKGDEATKKKVLTLLRKAKIDFALTSGVHASTLKAFVKRSLEKGVDLPRAISVHVQPKVDLIIHKP